MLEICNSPRIIKLNYNRLMKFDYKQPEYDILYAIPREMLCFSGDSRIDPISSGIVDDDDFDEIF